MLAEKEFLEGGFPTHRFLSLRLAPEDWGGDVGISLTYSVSSPSRVDE